MSDQPLQRTPAQNAGDARWLTIPHDDTCRTCGAEIKTNDRVYHRPAARVFKNDCERCGDWTNTRREYVNTFGDPPPLA